MGGCMSEAARARYFLIGLIAVCYVAMLALLPAVGLKIDTTEFTYLAGFSFGFSILVSLLCRWRKLHSLQAAVENAGLGLAITAPLVAFAYIAATANFPLQDKNLIAMDRNLGVDWLALIDFVDSRALLADTLKFAYRAFALELLFLPVILSLVGRSARAYQMTAAYGLICIFASIISIWYPASGTYAAFAIDLGRLEALKGTLGTDFVPQLMAVRSDPNFVLFLGRASGVISFPSVHAAVSVLCAWAMWPMKFMRWPFILLNVLMLSSAITEGGHYVVDLIAGIGVAGFATALVLYVTRSYPAPNFGMRKESMIA